MLANDSLQQTALRAAAEWQSVRLQGERTMACRAVPFCLRNTQTSGQDHSSKSVIEYALHSGKLSWPSSMWKHSHPGPLCEARGGHRGWCRRFRDWTTMHLALDSARIRVQRRRRHRGETLFCKGTAGEQNSLRSRRATQRSAVAQPHFVQRLPQIALRSSFVVRALEADTCRTKQE